jgi:hypothetical protein
MAHGCPIGHEGTACRNLTCPTCPNLPCQESKTAKSSWQGQTGMQQGSQPRNLSRRNGRFFSARSWQVPLPPRTLPSLPARPKDGQDSQGAAEVSHLRHSQRGADCGQELAPSLRLHREGDDRLRGGATRCGPGRPQDCRAHPGAGGQGA